MGIKAIAMSLSEKQKKYIKKNVRVLPLETIAVDLGLKENVIRKYLKKIWRHDKYEKYINKNQPDNVSETSALNFSLNRFFYENMFVFIGLFFLVLIIYINSFGNSFVSDDIPAFVNDTHIQNASNIFKNGIIGSPEQFIFFLGYKIGGLNPASFRVFNVIFHIGSAWLIFIIISLLTKKRIAILAALLFSVHPIATESITWISGIPYSMSGFLVLLSLLTYILKFKKIWPLVFFFLALLASEKVIIFPFILFIFEFVQEKIKYNWKKLIPYFSLSLFWLITFVFMGKFRGRISALETQSYQDSSGLYNPLIQIPVSIASYLKLIFWPSGLTLYHTEMTFATGQYIICLMVFLIYLVAVFISWRKNRPVFFWLSFFFITLLPTLTPLKIAWIVAERYVYLGSLGIFVVVAMMFDWLLEKAKYKDKQYKYSIYAIFTIIILALSVRTIARNMDWKNEDTLWLATAKTSPSGANTHNNLGDVYDRQGNLEKSAEEFKKAIELKPNYADAYHNLGNVYYKMNKLSEATEAFKKASEINPRLWESYQNLAAIYFSQGNYQKSLEAIRKALEINPNDKNLKENLALIQAKANP